MVNGVEIKVGQTWRTRGGDLAVIEKWDERNANYPWLTAEGYTYTAEGRFYINQECHDDLVALDEPQALVYPPLTNDERLLGDEHEALSFHPLPDAGINETTEPLPTIDNIKQSNPKDLIGSKKAKLSVVPSGVLFALGNAMLEGACKYGRHNFRGVGVRASVYYDATIGHLFDWWEGQDIDPESGELHITKAIASLTVALDAIQQGKMYDDRPPRSRVFKAHFNANAAAIIERHKDKSPRHYTIGDTAEVGGPMPVFKRKKTEDTEGGAA